MDNGDAIQFLANNPDHDRRQLVSTFHRYPLAMIMFFVKLLEIAQGLQYLHNHGVAHGDVRCVSLIIYTSSMEIHNLQANVLISRGRVARLSDFGLSVLLSDVSMIHSTACA